MAGHKREKRPGVWELVVYLGRDPVTNRKRWKSETFHGGERLADKALAKLVTEYDSPHEKPGTQASLNYTIEQWLRLQQQLGRAPSTLRTYQGYFETWIEPILGKTSLDKLTAGDIRSLHGQMTEAGKSPSTIRQVHAIIRGALRFAVEREWYDRNVAAIISPPKLSPTAVVAATPAEANALYRAAGAPGEDLPTAIALGTHTGGRLGELCALRWSDIDDGVIHFYSTKTHQTGDVPITATLAQRLTERLTFLKARAESVGVELVDNPFILSFWSDGSKKPASSSYSHAFARVRDQLGLPHLHFHTLRHAFVTQALAAGVDPLTVSKLVRHRDMTMIGRVFGHGTPEAFRQASRKINRAFKTKTPALDK